MNISPRLVRPLLAGAPEWSVLCDFDGTISRADTTDALLTRFADPAWEDIEAEWKSGRIGSRECMARQIALVRASRTELDAWLDTVEIDPAFAAFVADCERLGLPLCVVSDGVDYSIRRILARHDLGHLPVVANRLIEAQPGRYRLDFPYFDANCSASSGVCKCAQARRVAPRRTLLIGDGASDFCLSGSVDFVFAKDRLLARCTERGIEHRAFTGFDEVRRLLASLIAPRPHPVRPVTQPSEVL